MADYFDNVPNTMTGEEIVVSGISGIFPNSNSVQEFMDNLYNKVDMVTEETRCNVSDPEVPKYIGTVNGTKKFDAQFFKVGYQQALKMEPMSKKVLEHSYGAIFDSGNTHVTLKGKIVGVFVGSSYADHSALSMFDVHKASDSIVGGTSKAMMANRISYWLDGKGPSYCIDYSCTSSSAALEQAYNFIKNGDCDCAIVGGGNLCTFPSLSLNIKKAGLLCLDGKTKCFDKNGDGYVRSEAVNVIFLQRAKDAKRVYAEVVHAEGAYQLKTNDRFLPIRKPEDLQKFLSDIYSKTEVDPKDVEYVEANAAALAEGDQNETEAIANVFSGNKAVMVGSVKSNMGHCESASGICSLMKLCLAYHRGEIPANLHLQDPVEAVKDGKVQVLTENTQFDRGYTALNNLSLTGANYHVILKGHYKKKNLKKYKCQIPRLVLVSGRQEACVTHILNALKSKQVDAEEIALLHNIFRSDIVEHTSRGFTVLDTIKESTMAVTESVDHYSGVKPPLWFVFSGMGSQWPGMGADLMRVPIFAGAIERCRKALEPKGIDLLKVITELDNTLFDNVVNAFVGIGAVQIGLTDILKEMGIVPDYIIGHSLGETACAYYDNALTTEQMMLSMYSRGRAIQESDLVKGTMAAVGLGYKTLVKQCPPEIDIGCRNSCDSSTISGPADVMEKFVSELTQRGVFAKTVNSANIAYHSRYVSNAGPALLRRLKAILKEPKLRSDKWISTSVPKERWDEPVAKYSSAEYHMNNLLNPVLFEDVLNMIPENAVIVEIAPHGLLQAILKRSNPKCTHIPLTKRRTTDSTKFLLEAIGKLYMCGFNPKVDILYPKISFPVSTETPLLSHLVAWDHSEDWPLESYKVKKIITSASRKIVFSLQDYDYKYLEGYVRNGVNVLPEAALLAFVWETLAMYQGTDFRNLSVNFKDIQFHDEVTINAEKLIRLNIMISKGNNTFELTHEDRLIVSGWVSKLAEDVTFQSSIDCQNESSDEFEESISLNDQDIYRMLKMRGYSYRDTFRSILSANVYCTKALIKWTDQWIPFLDSLIQLNTVSGDYNGVSKPKLIRVLSINVKEREKSKYEIVNGSLCYDAQVNDIYQITSCAGVQIGNIIYTDVPLEENTADVLVSKIFFPYYHTEEVNINDAIEMNLQIISENSKSNHILITKICAEKAPKEFEIINEAINKTHIIPVEVKTVIKNDEFNIKNIVNEEMVNVIVIENVLQNLEDLKSLLNLPEDTFVMSIEDKVPKMHSVKNLFSILSCVSDGKKIITLMKKISNNQVTDTCFIPIRFDDTFSWVSDVYSKLPTAKRVVLISERQPFCGTLGFVKKLKASGHDNISVVVIDDFNAPKFDPNNDFYKDQLQRNMNINVMRKGQWGSFYYKSSQISQKQKSFALKNLSPGNLENVSWVEAPKISADRELTQVCYSGLSVNDYHKIKDIMDNHGASLLGMDYSGINKNGDKVMGLICGGSAASTIEVEPSLVWPVPDHWSLEDAATVPLAYVQAYYCLTIRVSIQKEKRVLICDGSNSVGLAAISICLSYNCTVFTIVDTEDKKRHLIGLYPQLGENNIICSNDDSFFETLMSTTKGQKFKYVLNFASSTNRQAAIRCVSFRGCFLDMSKHDMYNNDHFGMSFLKQECSYISVDVLNIFKPEFSKNRKVLQKTIAQGIVSGVVKPLIRVVFPPTQATQALKVLSLNQHIGKVLIRVRDPSIAGDGLETIPRISYSPHDVVIIVCDEKGIGLELADKLIDRGARKIFLHLKKVSGYIHTKILTWSKQKVSVKLSSDNLQTEKGSASFVKNALNFGKVKAVFVVFDPKHTDNGVKEDFINVFKKQSLLFMNLDVASRNCQDLSHFIIISRLSQSASDEYSLSLTERVCDARNEMGHRTLIVRYKSLAQLDDDKIMDKTKPQPLSALFNAMESSLKLGYTNVLTFNIEQGKKEIIDEEKEDGMYAFYRHVDTEVNNVEATAIVELPTLVSNGINTNWDPKDSYIILVPGFEGRPEIFESVAERLKMRAVSINLSPDLEGDYIEEIAMHALEELAKKIKDDADKEEEMYDPYDKDDYDRDIRERRRRMREIRNKRFYIMGYSFGVNIALELAYLLEMQGKTGVVYCIDSSPDAMRATIDAVLGQVSKDQLQNHVLNHMYNLLTGKKGKELKRDLKSEITFDAKVEETLRRMKGVVKYSDQYKKLVLESAYRRIVMAQQYKPMYELKSKLVLMKNPKHMMAGKLKDDYGLSQYTSQPVKILPLLAGDPALGPYDTRVSNIVNLFVEGEVLNDFKTRNLCDLYLSDYAD